MAEIEYDTIESIQQIPTGRAIRAARKALGWSLEDLASRAHIATSTLQSMETDKAKPIYNNWKAVLKVLSEDGGVQLLVDDHDRIFGIRWPKRGS